MKKQSKIPKIDLAGYRRSERIKESFRQQGGKVPLATPPAARRRIALLWVVAREFSEGFVVGASERPPYTDDMRSLVKNGLLELVRGQEDDVRRNILRLTKVGRSHLDQFQPELVDIVWVTAALGDGSLR